jgi:hypothetical protein
VAEPIALAPEAWRRALLLPLGHTTEQWLGWTRRCSSVPAMSCSRRFSGRTSRSGSSSARRFSMWVPWPTCSPCSAFAVLGAYHALSSSDLASNRAAPAVQHPTLRLL